MRWHLKYGKQNEFFKTLAAEGKDVPALLDKPRLYPDLMWIWESFITLSHSREQGFNGPQPLRFSEMQAFANELDLVSNDMRLRFFKRIQLLDQTYMQFFADEAKKRESREKK